MTEEKAIDVALLRASLPRSKSKGMKRRSVRLLSGLCDVCGEVYFVMQSYSGGFCSNKCRGLTNRGENNCRWKGGRSINGGGYVSVYNRDHHQSEQYGNRVLEHKIIMEKILGRRLFKFENVHHKNGIKTDNRPENLELWTKPQTPGQRPRDLINWIVANYRSEVEARLTDTKCPT